MNEKPVLTEQEKNDMLMWLEQLLVVIKDHINGKLTDSQAMALMFDICYKQMVRKKYN